MLDEKTKLNVYDHYKLLIALSNSITGKKLNWKDELFIEFAIFKVNDFKHEIFKEIQELSLFELMKILAEMEQ